MYMYTYQDLIPLPSKQKQERKKLTWAVHQRVVDSTSIQFGLRCLRRTRRRTKNKTKSHSSLTTTLALTPIRPPLSVTHAQKKKKTITFECHNNTSIESNLASAVCTRTGGFFSSERTFCFIVFSPRFTHTPANTHTRTRTHTHTHTHEHV